MSRLTSPGYRNQESSSALWIGWAVYGGIAFLGVCFGVWAGNQRPRTVEIVKPTPQDQANAKQPDTTAPDPKAGNNTPPAKGVTPQPQKKYEPTTPEPKKNEPMTNV